MGQYTTVQYILGRGRCPPGTRSQQQTRNWVIGSPGQWVSTLQYSTYRVTVAARLAPDLDSRHGTGSLGHRVNWSVHYSTVHTGSRSLPAWHQISTADTELGHWVTGSMGQYTTVQYILGHGRCPPGTRSRQQTRNRVIGSPGQWVIWASFHVRVTGSSV